MHEFNAHEWSSMHMSEVNAPAYTCISSEPYIFTNFLVAILSTLCATKEFYRNYKKWSPKDTGCLPVLFVCFRTISWFMLLIASLLLPSSAGMLNPPNIISYCSQIWWICFMDVASLMTRTWLHLCALQHWWVGDLVHHEFVSKEQSLYWILQNCC